MKYVAHARWMRIMRIMRGTIINIPYIAHSHDIRPTKAAIFQYNVQRVSLHMTLNIVERHPFQTKWDQVCFFHVQSVQTDHVDYHSAAHIGCQVWGTYVQWGYTTGLGTYTSILQIYLEILYRTTFFSTQIHIHHLIWNMLCMHDGCA